MTTKAQSISLADLSNAIDAAIKDKNLLAQTGAGPNLSLRWEIVGRRIPGIDAGAAFEIAQKVAESISIDGVQAEPAISRIDKDILVGFIDRGQLARSIGGG